LVPGALGHRQPWAVLARQPQPRDVLAHHGEHVARTAVLRHHPAGWPADDLAGTLRGGNDRRRQHLRPLPLRHFAAAEAGDLHRDHVLGDFHLLRFPARLRAHEGRAGERHPSVRDLCVRRGDGRRSVRARCVYRSLHAAAVGVTDRRHGGCAG
jgi:hypothetical protein